MPSFEQGLAAVQGSPVGLYLLPAMALVGGAMLWAGGGKAVKPMFVIASTCLGAAIGAARLTPVVAGHVQSVPPVYVALGIGAVAGLVLAIAFFRAVMGVATALTLAAVAMLAAAAVVGVKIEDLRPGDGVNGTSATVSGLPAVRVRSEYDDAVAVYDRSKKRSGQEAAAERRGATDRRGGYTGPGKSQPVTEPARSGRSKGDRAKDGGTPAQRGAGTTSADAERVARELAEAGGGDGADAEALKSLGIDQAIGPDEIKNFKLDGMDLSALAGVDTQTLSGGLTGLGLGGAEGSESGLDRAAVTAMVKERATAAWSNLPAKARHSLIVAGLAGASLGLIVGVVMPKRSAAMMTATLGGAMMLASGVALVRTMDPGATAQKMLALMDQRGPAAWLVAWGALAVLGMAIQGSRKKKKVEEEAA